MVSLVLDSLERGCQGTGANATIASDVFSHIVPILGIGWGVYPWVLLGGRGGAFLGGQRAQDSRFHHVVKVLVPCKGPFRLLYSVGIVVCLYTIDSIISLPELCGDFVPFHLIPLCPYRAAR